jgi:hypothetical protein
MVSVTIHLLKSGENPPKREKAVIVDCGTMEAATPPVSKNHTVYWAPPVPGELDALVGRLGEDGNKKIYVRGMGQDA